MFLFKNENIYIIASVIALFLLLTKVLIGIERNRSRLKSEAVMNVFIYVMLYHIILYILGIFIGFTKSPYSFSIINLIRNITPVLLIIGLTEVFRYANVIKSEKSNKLLLFVTIVLIMLDITVKTSMYNLDVSTNLLEIASLVILPAIANNIFLGYLALYFGWAPAILYRVLMEIPEYIIPILPNTNEYLDAIVTFLFPLLLLLLFYRLLNRDKKDKSPLKKNYFGIVVTSVLVIITVFTVGLTSGLFKYYMISIGSGSMEPNIYVGDSIIVKKEDNLKNIEIDDILVFNHNNSTVVHRVTRIMEKNSSYEFITKGDNNEEEDNWVVSEKDVIGTAELKIRYIGYPTIWLNEKIN